MRGWVDLAVADVGDASDAVTFLAVLKQARRRHPSINPLTYDLDGNAVAQVLHDATSPVPPPQAPVIEMAPFVVPRP